MTNIQSGGRAARCVVRTRDPRARSQHTRESLHSAATVLLVSLVSLWAAASAPNNECPMTTQPVRRVPFLLLGAGGVGNELLKTITRARDTHLKRYNLRLMALAVSDSSAVLQTDDPTKNELTDEQLQTLVQHKASGKRIESLTQLDDSAVKTKRNSNEDPASFLERVVKECEDKLPGAIIVDCTATDATIPTLRLVSRPGSTLRATMANKKPVSESISIFEALSSAHPRVRFESTVGAGLPVVAAMERLVAAEDGVQTVAGSFSGTLGYVMSHLQEGERFSDIVTRAKKLGYTEPDPRDDLGGVDVARKALILARMLGSKLELKDVQVEPLYPQSMSNLSVEEFMAALPSLDDAIAERVAQAADKNCVLRYAAHVDVKKNHLVVGPREVDATSPLGSLKGTDNLVEIYSDVYPESPLVIRGAGAGVESTAAGVLADMIELAFVRD